MVVTLTVYACDKYGNRVSGIVAILVANVNRVIYTNGIISDDSGMAVFEDVPEGTYDFYWGQYGVSSDDVPMLTRTITASTEVYVPAYSTGPPPTPRQQWPIIPLLGLGALTLLTLKE